MKKKGKTIALLLCLLLNIIFIQCEIAKDETSTETKNKTQKGVKFNLIPVEIPDEFQERVQKHSNCTADANKEINDKCLKIIQELIINIERYEHHFITDKCERANMGCFTHRTWTESAECVCSICDHVWFYDEAMHYRFSKYFQNHRCIGNISPNIEDKTFCAFMKETERNIIPKACEIENKKEIKIPHTSDAMMIKQTYFQYLIMWTIGLAFTMSLSLYWWIS